MRTLYVHTYIYTYVYTYIYTYIRMIHTYVYTYIRIHTYHLPPLNIIELPLPPRFPPLPRYLAARGLPVRAIEEWFTTRALATH